MLEPKHKSNAVSGGIVIAGAALTAATACHPALAPALAPVFASLSTLGLGLSASVAKDCFAAKRQGKATPPEALTCDSIRSLLEKAVAAVLAAIPVALNGDQAIHPNDETAFIQAKAALPEAIAAAIVQSEGELGAASDFDLPFLLTDYVTKEGAIELLTPDSWLPLVETTTELWQAHKNLVANALHRHLARAIWQQVGVASTQQPQTFAAVNLLYLSRILDAVQDQPQLAASVSDTAAIEAYYQSLYAQLDASQAQWFERWEVQAERRHREMQAAHQRQDESHQRQETALQLQAEALQLQGEELQRLKAALNLPRPLVTRHQLPPVAAAFGGRDEDLQILETALTQTPATGTVITGQHAGVQGLGGVGKTALAVALAHRLQASYPDAQLMLNLRGADPDPANRVTPVQAMQQIIRAFVDPATPLPDDLPTLQPHYHGVLHDAGQVLLLLDNAATADQIEPLIPPANCLLIVTSRTQFDLPGLVARHLDCLAPPDATALLLKIAPRLSQPTAAAAAELLGHLPLALEVFAGAVNRQRLTAPAALLDKLRQRELHLDRVTAAFQLSAASLDPTLRQQWLQLAVFPATFTLAAAAALWQAEDTDEPDVAAAEVILANLTNASLVEFNEATNRLRLHDLIRQFCDQQLAEADRFKAQGRHAVYYHNVLASANELYLKGGAGILAGLQQFDAERTNIETGQAWAATHAAQYEAVARLAMSYPDAGVYVLDLRHTPHQRINWLETQLAAAQQLHQRDMEGNALCNLGTVYAALGQMQQAITYHEQALVIARDIGDRRGEGSALGNLGIAYAALGQMRQAITYYQQRLSIALEIGDRRGEGSALGNLGNAYADLGQTQQAIICYQQRLTIARELGDRRGEGQALSNLGNTYAALGQTQQAITYHEQALVIVHDIGDRRGEGQVLGNLGIAYAALGQMPQAITNYQQALAIDREIGDRRGEGKALGNLGNAYADLGQTHQAITYYEQYLSIARDIGDIRGQGIASFNLSLTLHSLGEQMRALELAEATLAIFEQIEDPSAAIVREQLEGWRAKAE